MICEVGYEIATPSQRGGTSLAAIVGMVQIEVCVQRCFLWILLSIGLVDDGDGRGEVEDPEEAISPRAEQPSRPTWRSSRVSKL